MGSTHSGQGLHAVGIDLGTTYSSISYLDPQGQPVTLPNSDGELATPSVVFFDGDEIIVGTEALRNAVMAPERVVTESKRYMGDPRKCWMIDRQAFRPGDIAAMILRRLLANAEEHLGRIRHAVITVPAQFSETQRQETMQAGLRAGLERVDVINEPVAAALCYVLSEGMWFAEIANEQTVLVFDLGGGTLDLSLVRYGTDEVRVIAAGGDLHLGGVDWNRVLESFACDQYVKEFISDPRLDRESMQALTNEVEQVKRSLTVRPKAPLTVQHEGRRKVYTIERMRFESLTRGLVKRTEEVTRGMLKSNKLGWAHVDAVLATGGASRMPMIREMLQRISGRTLNTRLSPDQSICHGAAYYAGMLISGQRMERTTLSSKASQRLAKVKQQSVNARSLGILVRDTKTNERVPHYVIPPNTPLPAAYRQKFGTVIPNQRRVNLQVVESGTRPEEPHVVIGRCVIEELSHDLPVGSPIDVTIRYDNQARIHVEATDVVGGVTAKASIDRSENVRKVAPSDPAAQELVPIEQPEPLPSRTEVSKSAASKPDDGASTAGEVKEQAHQQPSQSGAASPAKREARSEAPRKTQSGRPATGTSPRVVKRRRPQPPSISVPTPSLEDADRPVPLCNDCGEVLNSRGQCPACAAAKVQAAQKASQSPTPRKAVRRKRPASSSGKKPRDIHSAKTEALRVPRGDKSGNDS